MMKRASPHSRSCWSGIRKLLGVSSFPSFSPTQAVLDLFCTWLNNPSKFNLPLCSRNENFWKQSSLIYCLLGANKKPGWRGVSLNLISLLVSSRDTKDDDFLSFVPAAVNLWLSPGNQFCSRALLISRRAQLIPRAAAAFIYPAWRRGLMK